MSTIKQVQEAYNNCLDQVKQLNEELIAKSDQIDQEKADLKGTTEQDRLDRNKSIKRLEAEIKELKIRIKNATKVAANPEKLVTPPREEVKLVESQEKSIADIVKDYDIHLIAGKSYYISVYEEKQLVNPYFQAPIVTQVCNWDSISGAGLKQFFMSSYKGSPTKKKSLKTNILGS